MKEDILEKYIEQTLNGDTDLSEFIDDISIPDFEETMNRFKQNLGKSQEIKKDSTESRKIKTYCKKLSVIAAAFILAFAIPVFNNMNNLNNNINPNENIQRPNPLVEVKSEEEAEKSCGFHIEKVKHIPEGYEKESIVYIDITEKDKLVRQIFMDKNDGKIDFEKYEDINDIKNDWNEYDKEEEVSINNNKVILHYRENKLYKATWNNNGFVYDILSSKDIKKEEMIKMIDNLE